MKVLADVLEALQEPPGGGDVDESPLDDLAAAQPGPGALGSTLCRRVGHSAAPMARAVYANRGRAARRMRGWESGNLETCLSAGFRVRQDSSFPVFRRHPADPPGRDARARAGSLAPRPAAWLWKRTANGSLEIPAGFPTVNNTQQRVRPQVVWTKERGTVIEVIDSGARVLHQVDAGLRGIANANVAPGPSFLTAQMRP